ncbi:hypothetical protein LIA77_03828 [Sarocladium implicatum]|nr:hypothetical protein LIA77_03828 [Sarocladium implicatum]
MAATTTQPASKSAKKKAAKGVQRTESPAPSSTSAADKTADTTNDAYESPYIKELQKNVRNINKKISNASKVEEIVAQHPGKTLEELVANKTINADQKAQVQKKPGLQAQLAQTEEQLTQYLKVDEQYRTRANADKAEWEKALEKAKADAVAAAAGSSKQSLQDSLLVLSQFLRLAAYRREEAQDPESDESQAIEGVLLAIYSGDESAVSSMLKLVEGSDEQVLSVPGEQLQTSYSVVKSLAQEYKSPVYAENAPAEAEPQPEVGTDPTIAHATASELESGDLSLTNGQSVDAVTNGIANASISDDAANPVAESNWDLNNNMSASQEWVDVKVPRDPTETEAGLDATPAAATNQQSWADDHPEPTQEAPSAPADPNDGFQSVQRNRRPERDGNNSRGRGRGGRGDYRGRGRGDGRGRGGRGGQHRGGRRNEES